MVCERLHAIHNIDENSHGDLTCQPNNVNLYIYIYTDV